MKEKKNIAITLQEAKEWYKGDNLTLRELALKVFTKEELEKQELPKTWEEFCKRNDLPRGESYISIGSDVVTLKGTYKRDNLTDRNMCTSKQEAEAFRALMQIRQLRKAYVKDWEPDWESNYEDKYCINFVRNKCKIDKYWEASHILSFPTLDLATQFLDNFKDLLEIAKPLL